MHPNEPRHLLPVVGTNKESKPQQKAADLVMSFKKVNLHPNQVKGAAMARFAGRRFVTPATVETQVFDWGTIKWLSEPRVTGTDRFTAGVVILEPGKGHTRHNHPGVEEILYIISGEGDQMVEVPDGTGGWRPERRTVRAGALVHIP